MIDKQNVFTFNLSLGYKKFHAVCATCSIDPLESDKNPEVLPPTDLTCHLFHPDRDGPQLSDPVMMDKSEAFFPGMTAYPRAPPPLQKKVLSQESPKEEARKMTVTLHSSVNVQLNSSLQRNKQSPALTKKRLKALGQKNLTGKTKISNEPENLFDMDGESKRKL
jgi:hypothetical protein